jgi:hypothetical protein
MLENKEIERSSRLTWDVWVFDKTFGNFLLGKKKSKQKLVFSIGKNQSLLGHEKKYARRLLMLMLIKS